MSLQRRVFPASCLGTRPSNKVFTKSLTLKKECSIAWIFKHGHLYWSSYLLSIQLQTPLYFALPSASIKESHTTLITTKLWTYKVSNKSWSCWCLTCVTNSESSSAIDPVNAGLVTPLPQNLWIKELNQTILSMSIKLAWIREKEARDILKALLEVPPQSQSFHRHLRCLF